MIARVTPETCFFFGFLSINGYSLSSQIIAGVVWTLKYEVLFYLVLPVFAAIYRKKNKISLVSLISVAIVCAVFIINRATHLFGLWHLLQFTGGIAAAILVNAFKDRKLVNNPIVSLVAVTSLAVEMVFFDDPYSLVPFILLTVFFISIAFGNDLFGVLSWKSLRWLGEISYSTYLSHGLLRFIILEDYLCVRRFAWFVFARVPITIVLVIINSLTYMYIEIPGMSLGAKIIRRFRERRKVSARELDPK